MDHVYLIAEDERDSQFLVKRAFLKAGLDVPIHFAPDGVETLEYLRGEGKFKNRSDFPFPALLLLDFNMPRMNGLEVLKELREDARLKKLVVIMLSSSVDERQIAKAFELGVNSYVESRAIFPRWFRSFLRSINIGLAVTISPILKMELCDPTKNIARP
jgi:CheY-like chemotaxis protein